MAAPPALEAAADNPEGSFTSAAAEAARSRAAGAAEEEPACCVTTGTGVEKKEASLPTLKAAAGNPEGSFTPAAAEAGLEVGGDAPVMTEAVGRSSPLWLGRRGSLLGPACNWPDPPSGYGLTKNLYPEWLWRHRRAKNSR